MYIRENRPRKRFHPEHTVSSNFPAMITRLETWKRIIFRSNDLRKCPPTLFTLRVKRLADVTNPNNEFGKPSTYL